MGTQAGQVDVFLRDGGLVVTASDRAARAVAVDFHRARHAEGLAAWPAPGLLPWSTFVRTAWEERTLDGRLLLNPTQEQALWAQIVGQGRQMATLLEGPRHCLAILAMDAHELLCSFAPQFLQCDSARSAWQQDAAAFSSWLTGFDQACRIGNLLSPSRLPLALIPLLNAETTARPPLLLVGFDRILPTQQALFDAWGSWRRSTQDQPATKVQFHSAIDAQSELAACANWCASQLADFPHSRFLVITQDAASRRGEIERAFLQHAGSANPLPFEFSLGIPLSQVALTRSAFLLLRWLSGPIEEAELDWLLSTGHAATSADECLDLQMYMRALRRNNLERTGWTLEAFLSQLPAAQSLPAAWSGRMRQASARLAARQRLPQSPLDWAGLVPLVLETAGWPGYRPLSSTEFQALSRWEHSLDTGATLGFDGTRIQWSDFLTALSRILDETLFVPQSHSAPIQIAGAAESAGLTADAVWFLGASEDAWPARGPSHPLLPPALQREAGMPHATPQIDWELARAVTARLLSSAPEVHFSYSCQQNGSETRPSRLAVEFAGDPVPLPAIAPPPKPQTVNFEDASQAPFPPGKAGGGASVLTSQSQCPFKAFATTRLGAQTWNPAEPSLTALQRGLLLHEVLHRVWAGPPAGIRTHSDLQNLPDRSPFVAGHVRQVFRDKLPAGASERLPRRYLALEEQRLAALVTEWLDYEAARWPFKVAGTELDRTVSIAGLTLKLRLDRVDLLNDGSLLVIDYKTGVVSPKAWDLPRPEDVQLPLYAGFALDPGAELGGLTFARVRPGDQAFAGRIGNAKATLLPNLGNGTSLVKDALTAEQLIDWRQSIEQLARDFLAGKAQVDPRDAPKTCERCGLQTLCRIHEHQPAVDSEEDDAAAGLAEASDE